MTNPFDPEELKRLNQTPAERLLDWVEENFNKYDCGSNKGRGVGIHLVRQNEDALFVFAKILGQKDKDEIRQRIRLLECQLALLGLTLEMLETGYETESQAQERLAEKKRIQTEQRRSEYGI